MEWDTEKQQDIMQMTKNTYIFSPGINSQVNKEVKKLSKRKCNTVNAMFYLFVIQYIYATSDLILTDLY